MPIMSLRSLGQGEAQKDGAEMSEIEKQFKGNVGMFLVCAELSWRNLIALPTSRNTAGYDIVVQKPKTNKSVGIQVKCSNRRDFPVFGSHWRGWKQKLKEKVVCDFVFVDIRHRQPEYYILSTGEVRCILSSKIKGYVQDNQLKRNLSWEHLLENEQSQKKNAHNWTLKLADIEAYKDRWETITDRLI